MPRKQNQSREVKAHSAKKRVRVPIGSGNKLHVSPELMEEGYHYYWAVDRPGQIHMFEAAGYEKVTDSRGDLVTTPAGNGETHMLMRVDNEYYDEDFEAAQQKVTDTTEQKAQQIGEHEYVPQGKKKPVERDLI